MTSPHTNTANAGGEREGLIKDLKDNLGRILAFKGDQILGFHWGNLADFILERIQAAQTQTLDWLEADVKRLDGHNWTAETLALDTLVASGKADDYQKKKRDEIVTDRRAALIVRAILGNYRAAAHLKEKGQSK